MGKRNFVFNTNHIFTSTIIYSRHARGSNYTKSATRKSRNMKQKNTGKNSNTTITQFLTQFSTQIGTQLQNYKVLSCILTIKPPVKRFGCATSRFIKRKKIHFNFTPESTLYTKSTFQTHQKVISK